MNSEKLKLCGFPSCSVGIYVVLLLKLTAPDNYASKNCLVSCSGEIYAMTAAFFN